MTFAKTIKIIATGALALSALPVFSHVVLDQKSALAASPYKASFRVGHGCEGSATTGITVQIPAGFQGAKPYAKAGWVAAVQRAPLARPYDSQGKPVTQDVSVVSWTAASKDAALPDAHFDEFTLRGKLPEAVGPLWFKVLQTCENGSIDWSEQPASGTSTKGLKTPAALLEVTSQRPLAEPLAATGAAAVNGSHATPDSHGTHGAHHH